MSYNQTFSSNDSTIATVNGSCSEAACSFNKSRKPGKPGRMSYPCGYCDVYCTYRATECMFAVGIIANAIVLFLVARDRKLRNATFVSIAACAAADMCFLIIDLAVSFEAVVLTVTCKYPGILRRDTYMVLRLVVWFTANGHVTLLAVLRYVILVYPIKSKIYLSTRRVLLLSGLVWVLAVLCSVSVGLLGLVIDTSPRASYQFQLVLWTTVYLTPVTTTVTLHLVKLYKIGQTTTVTTNEQAKRRVQAMSKMVLLVIFNATALPFPFVLDGFLKSLGINIYRSQNTALHMRPISRMLVFLNHSINPVLYAFVSDAFRLSLKKMLGLDRNTSNVHSTQQ